MRRYKKLQRRLACIMAAALIFQAAKIPVLADAEGMKRNMISVGADAREAEAADFEGADREEFCEIAAKEDVAEGRADGDGKAEERADDDETAEERADDDGTAEERVDDDETAEGKADDNDQAGEKTDDDDMTEEKEEDDDMTEEKTEKENKNAEGNRRR